MRYEKKAFTRPERKRMVVHKFAEWIHEDRELRWANSYQIARALGMSPSGTFSAILKEMVNEQLLIAEVRVKPGRFETIYYTLYPGTFTMPKPRKIAINPGKKNSAQLEVWS